MANLKDYVTRKVVFRKNAEGKNVKFRKDKRCNFIDALIKMVMNDIVTIVYAENCEIKEMTFTTDECYDHMEFNRYDDKQADVSYSTTLKAGDVFYLESDSWKGKCLFQEIRNYELRFLFVKNSGDGTWNTVDINDILSGKAVGEVWEYGI
jgi:hypothetical protein